jgi:hypothetical protein
MSFTKPIGVAFTDQDLDDATLGASPSAGGKVGFYGTTPVTQRSNAAQATSAVGTASSADVTTALKAAVIEISLDANANGLADDPWFIIRGSSLPAAPASASQTQPWDNNGATPTPPSNLAWYPTAPAFPGWPAAYTTTAPRLPAPFEAIPLVNPGGPGATLEAHFGYADLSPTLRQGDTNADDVIDDPSITPADFYTAPDNPLAVAVTPGSGGGDAFDIAWAHPDLFGHVGVFSGALWWRWSDVDPADPDADRIIHDSVCKSHAWPAGQRFWFQCGTLDETDDRNNNGVIDSIDDTLDLIRDLRHKGCPDVDIRYLELEGGEHNVPTWSKAMVHRVPKAPPSAG